MYLYYCFYPAASPSTGSDFNMSLSVYEKYIEDIDMYLQQKTVIEGQWQATATSVNNISVYIIGRFGSINGTDQFSVLQPCYILSRPLFMILISYMEASFQCLIC